MTEAEQLRKLARQFQSFGVTADEAAARVRAFMKAFQKSIEKVEEERRLDRLILGVVRRHLSE